MHRSRNRKMKPPSKKPAISSSKPSSRGRVCRRSNRKKRSYLPSPYKTCTRSTEEINAVSPHSAGPSPASLPRSPSFSLSFSSDLHNELFSFVDKLTFEPSSSTPLPPDRDRHERGVEKSSSTSLQPEGAGSTSSLLEMATSQVDRLSTSDLTPSLRSLPSFMTTPSKSGPREKLRLAEWGIPRPVLEQYSKRGIASMYQWQAECLTLPGVLQGSNLVFSAPTSAGKTFIAELLALKCVLETRKKVVIILPFVSIAHEKANYLQSIFEPNGVKVGGFVGGHSPSGGFAGVDIAICTIEKANSLINRLLEEGKVSDIGAVVVDELHMIGDSHRGYLLELLLTKLLYVSKKTRASTTSEGVGGESEMARGGRSGIQIIGMSATLPNLDTLAEWLEGGLYCTNFRPVPLREMVKVGSTLFDTDFHKIRDLSTAESANDEEDIARLCEETVTSGHSVLIFCPTKQWCETLARSISSAPFLRQNSATEPSNGARIKEEGGSKVSLQCGALLGVVEQLRRTQVGLDGVLEKTVPHGVGFHHAGLTFDEREIVEGAFRQGLLRILVATSTLSSGVNLPARLVIIRSAFFRRSLLDVLVYKQMVGRAGRKGVDERGESVLICKQNEKQKVSSLFLSAPAPVTSCLDVERRKERGRASDVIPIRRALLEVIMSGTATTVVEIETYFRCTLLFAEMKKKSSPRIDPVSLSEKLVSTTLDYLLANEFIAVRNTVSAVAQEPRGSPRSGGGREYHATQLGAATVTSALSPEEALVVFSELRKARRSFVLESELHIIYLVTPVYIQEQWPSIDWYRFLCLLERLPADARHVASTLGVHESFLAGAIQGRLPERTTEQRERLRVHRRFLTALALHDLVHESPIVHVAGKYGVSKGLLQTLQRAAGTFSGMMTVFCGRLGWKNLELLLSQFQSQLSFGVERELCDLVRVSLVNGFRARALYNAGFHSLSALATANPLAIEHCLRNTVPFRSSKMAAGEDGESLEGGRKGTWCGRLRRGMTECEAAREIVQEAQRILSEQMNLPLSAWRAVQQQLPTASAGDGEVEGEEAKEPPSSKRRKSTATGDLTLTHIIAPHVVDTSSGKPSSTFKTPKKPRKTKSRRNAPNHRGTRTKIGKFTSSPVIALCRVRTTSARPSNQTTQDPSERCPEAPPTPVQADKPRKDDSISYSPLFSPDSSGFFQKSPSLSLLRTPLPLEHFQHSSPPTLPQNRVADTPTHTSGQPLTVPSSLPCSLDMSSSFSLSTLAMIDAACEAFPTEDMSHSLISQHDTDLDKSVRDIKPVVKVAESPVVLGSSFVVDRKSVSPTTSSEEVAVCKYESNAAGKLEGRPKRHREKDVESSKAVPALESSAASPGPDVTQSRLRDLSLASHSQVSLSQSGACVIDVTSNSLLFQTFLSECLEQSSISFSVAVSTFSRQQAIGVRIVEQQTSRGLPIPHQSEQVVGVAISWGAMDAYYISMCRSADGEDSISLDTRIKALQSIFQSRNCREVMAYSIKRHVKILVSVFGVVPCTNCLDPLVADWMLNPDGKEKTLHKMVLHYLPDQPLLSEGGGLHEDLPLSNLATHGSEPRQRAAAESILASLLLSKLRPLLQEEGLQKPFLELEMPSLVALTKAELNGIGFSREECEALKQMLQLRLAQFERKAYTHAGRSFSLTSPEDVSQVLFLELQLLPPSDPKQQKTLGPNRRGKRRIQHISTAKDVLERLKSVHLLPGLILEWRRISSTVTKTVFPLFKDAVYHSALDSVRVHSTYHIHTATGRVGTSDPNLQMVQKEHYIGTTSSLAALLDSADTSENVSSLVSESQCYRDSCGVEGEKEGVSSEVKLLKTSVNMRSVFVPFPRGVFLAADYSQLELRILAHMSRDSKLLQVLNGEGDVFKMIAGEWLGVPAVQVTTKDRQNAKQICYGMVYGIGARALSEQLNIGEDDAARFMDTFKSKYPSIKKFIASTVQSCRENGLIVTLLGRKRYLSGIHSQNIHTHSQAERQAVNSTIQGSAADLVKTAMINIDHSLAREFSSSPPCLTLSSPSEGDSGLCHETVRGAYLVLQLHDELLYEVRERDLPHVAQIVRQEMENALELSVRFPVKMKVGSSWGSLSEYTPLASPKPTISTFKSCCMMRYFYPYFYKINPYGVVSPFICQFPSHLSVCANSK